MAALAVIINNGGKGRGRHGQGQTRARGQGQGQQESKGEGKGGALLTAVAVRRANVGNPRQKNTVSGSFLCCHDSEMSAKSADIWLSGQHVANILPTFSAKLIPGDQ